jgi:hypothetical protein
VTHPRSSTWVDKITWLTLIFIMRISMCSRKVLWPTLLGLFRVAMVVGLAKLTCLKFTHKLRAMIKVKGLGFVAYG